MITNFRTKHNKNLILVICLILLIPKGVFCQRQTMPPLEFIYTNNLPKKTNLIDCAPSYLGGNKVFNPGLLTNQYYDGNVNNPFAFGFIDYWSNAFGTPNFEFPSPLANINPAGMGSTYASGVVYSEGLLGKLSPLIQGNEYSLSFYLRTFNDISNNLSHCYNIYLMHCSDVPLYFPNPNANPMAPLGPIPPNSQRVFCETNSGNTGWHQVSICFTANQDYDMILIFPAVTPLPTTPNYTSYIGFLYPELLSKSEFNINIISYNGNSCIKTLSPSYTVSNASYKWYLNGTLFSTIQNPQINTAVEYGSISLQVTLPNSPSNTQCGQQLCTLTAATNITMGTCSHTWPKVYEWGSYTLSSDLSQVTQGKNGNMYYSFHSSNIQNNLNHSGVLPSISNSNFLVHYDQYGTSLWNLSNLTDVNDVFILRDGSIRTRIANISNDYVYFNGLTGVQISGPSYVPADEKILAETNTGTYITCKTGQISVHSISSTSSVSINGEIEKAFFNPFSNKLFVKVGRDLNIYILVNNSLSLLSTTYNNSAYRLCHVDNQNNIYVYADHVMGGSGYTQLCYFNLNNSSNPFTPVSIPGFANEKLAYKTCFKNDPYTSDHCLVYEYGNNIAVNAALYMLNFTTQTEKKIETNGNFYYEGTLTPFPSEFTCSYFENGDDVFIAGQVYGDWQPVSIGNHQFYNVPSTSTLGASYLGKFSLQGDFSFKTLKQNSSLEVGQNKSFRVVISPNPTLDFLSIQISESQKDRNEIYRVSIVEGNGNVVLQTISKKLIISQNIKNLHAGNYFVTITNRKGNQSTLQFIKE